MGFFSFKTCDTQESIANSYSSRKTKTVYMLQPNGLSSIVEPAYEGYGVFNGVDCYAWVCEMNSHCLQSELNFNRFDIEKRRGLGVMMALGSVYEDQETGKVWHIFTDGRDIIPGEFHKGNYGTEFEGSGMTVNQCVESGRLVEKDIIEMIDLKYPLKFSFNPNARYEDYGPSENCPHQGYFYF